MPTNGPLLDIERLLPLLPAIAEKIGRGTHNRKNTLSVLCRAAGIEGPELKWAEPELRRWTAILVAAQQDGSPSGRDDAVQTLIMRGVPEVAARTAVTTAAIRPQGTHPIQVSSNSITMGELPAGTDGSVELVVRGGPGTASPNSDAITVEPATFGPDETVLHIHVAPMPPGGVLWGTIALESTDNRLLIDITGRWAIDSTDVESMDTAWAALGHGSTPPSFLTVGRGASPADYRSITEAIKAAPPNTRILIQPGIYPEALVLDKPIELISDGSPGGVDILSGEDNPCISMKTDHAHVKGVSLTSFSADGVEIESGSLNIEDCFIKSYNAGIAVHGPRSSAAIRACQIRSVYHIGVMAYDHAQCVIDDCEFHENGKDAVSIKEGANFTIRNCSLHHGKDGGIWVYGKARGIIEDCDIYSNAEVGIAISGSGVASVRRCRIHDGQKAGIWVVKHGRGIIEDSDIFGNADAGLSISSGGDPTVRNCHIHDGKGSGVYVWKQGRGTITGSDIHNNAHSGIAIESEGDPTVRNCHIHDGKGSGVYVWKQGWGTITGSDIHNNAHSGIAILSGGDPTVRNCHIHDGKGSGVY
ncbi:right-handed parallel beta-helix repeat-containing protein, partial [Streptomyces sp. NPDC050759]|uniref:right-handed parallel beta-helix repeat-containing protein n=1 Tax=Streptomyces sp. NPDC050759 TaxID=3365635 RepID=UPI00379FC835